MVTNEMFDALTKEEKDGLVLKRMNLRNMYCGGYGLEHMMNVIHSSKVLGKTNPSDQAENGARNLVVDMLDELGFFDEDFIRFALKALKEFPLIHKESEENKGAF